MRRTIPITETRREPMKRKLAAATAGAVLLLAPAGALAATTQSAKTSGHANASQTANYQTPLAIVGGAATVGTSQYQAQPGQRELQVELQRLPSLRGLSLVVRVDGARVGSMHVSSNGTAQLTRNTELGQSVPLVGHGSTVTVTTTTGAAITSGRF
jgi:hypothetical protein